MGLEMKRIKGYYHHVNDLEWTDGVWENSVIRNFGEMKLKVEAIQSVDGRYATDWSAIKGAIKGDLSNYLYKKTKRSPMILPVIMEV